MKKPSKKILPPKAFSKKVVASLPKHTDQDLKRYIGAVSENFGHHVSAVAEQFGGLNTKIDILTDEIGEIKMDISVLKEDVGILKEDVSVLKEDVGVLKEDMDTVKSNLEIIKSDLSRKVNYADFAALEKRVRLVETKFHR